MCVCVCVCLFVTDDSEIYHRTTYANLVSDREKHGKLFLGLRFWNFCYLILNKTIRVYPEFSMVAGNFIPLTKSIQAKSSN